MSEQVSLVQIFFAKNQSPASQFLLFPRKSVILRDALCDFGSNTAFKPFFYCQFCLWRAILQEYFLILADIFCPNTILLFFGYCI